MDMSTIETWLISTKIFRSADFHALQGGFFFSYHVFARQAAVGFGGLGFLNR